jgi:predicted DNA-binding transcriptional regulator AlpA
MPKQAALPPTLPPRLVGREAAAAYVCVSPNTFDDMIARKLMPKPRRLGEKRLAWDVRELDAAADALPHDGEQLAAVDDGWR